MPNEPQEPRLRGQSQRRKGPYPLGEFPISVAIGIGKQLVHRMAVGQVDITGDDFGNIFANAIGGQHRGKPLGIADVEWNGCAWGIKTVKHDTPFMAQKVRLISGRNSPAYSVQIDDVFKDLQATGAAILNVWNARVNEALKEHDDLRIVGFVRNFSTLEFMLFEIEAVRFVPAEFTWELNAKRNLIARDVRGETRFTWQPHGSQFTVHQPVPKGCFRFRIVKKPGTLELEHVLKLVGYQDDWIQPVTLFPL